MTADELKQQAANERSTALNLRTRAAGYLIEAEAAEKLAEKLQAEADGTATPPRKQ